MSTLIRSRVKIPFESVENLTKNLQNEILKRQNSFEQRSKQNNKLQYHDVKLNVTDRYLTDHDF